MILWGFSVFLVFFVFFSFSLAPVYAQENQKQPEIENADEGDYKNSPLVSPQYAPTESVKPEQIIFPGTSDNQAVKNQSVQDVQVEFLESVPPADAAKTANIQEQNKNKAQQDAFEASLNELMPTTPEQVYQYRLKVDGREKALVDTPPAAVFTRTECITLQPGFEPPKIELTPNLVTVLVLVDSSGSPWPITSTALGSGELFISNVLNTPTKNQVIISPQTQHGNSNLVLTLAGNDIPLIIRLETLSGVNASRKTDGMIVYQIMERGPNAPPPVINRPVAGPVNDLLYTILDGITPPGASILTAEPSIEETKIFQLGETVYVRTKNKLMWPSHRAVVSGVGGFHVYELPLVPSMMISKDGVVERVELTDVVMLGGK